MAKAATRKNTEKTAAAKINSIHGVVELTSNQGGRQAGETFNAEQATATGIAAEHFRPASRAVVDRSMKSPQE